MAAASGIEKGAVVRMRMKGSTETDLWLSSYLSTRVDITAAELLDARDRAASWTAALKTLDLDSGGLGAAFNEARKTGDDDAMARALADPVMVNVFGASENTIDRLRDQGANIAESAVSIYLTIRVKKTPEVIFSDVKSGKNTWGELLNSQGIRIDTLGDLIAEEVKKNY